MKSKNMILAILIILILIILCIIAVVFLNSKNQQKDNQLNNSVQENSNINTQKTVSQIQQEIDEQLANYEMEPDAFTFQEVSDETMLIQYLSNFQQKLNKNMQEAYQLLDSEYASKRFGDVTKFETYVNQKIQQIKQAYVAKYQVSEGEKYNQYTAIDQFGNYYIFRETAIMEYSVILDTYTLDLPEFIEKYKSSNPKQKVALNIDRFIKAINDGNYSFAYAYLSTGFKTNYFPTEQDFANYAKQTFYGRDTITYGTFKNEGNLYMYTITLQDKNQTLNPVQKTFIVQLRQETAFELSFDK